jgi:transposase
LPAGDAFRGRLILALADGEKHRCIVRSLKTSTATIARWKARFEQDRLAGLEARHRGGKRRTPSPAVQARVIRRLQQQPKHGSTHWSCRQLARELGLSKSTVQRILPQAKLKPHRLKRYIASNDPDFEAKAADVIGLYLSPPQHAAVFCVDEKTAIQALDGLDPALPLSPSRAERTGFEYHRHETLSPYAPLDVITGRVWGPDGQTAHQRRVHLIPHRTGHQSPLGPRDSYCSGQPIGPQDSGRTGILGGKIPRFVSTSRCLFFLVEPSGTVVCQDSAGK